MENLSAILRGKDDLVMENTSIPLPGKGEVQIRLSAVGICGSDIHFLRHGYVGLRFLTAPSFLGHEAAGVVSCLGEGVTHLQIGDRVALELGVPCWTCSLCQAGRYNVCPDMFFHANTPVYGSLRHYTCHDAVLCHKLPDNVSMEEGALAEPMAVTLQACRRAGVTFGNHVAILGAGPIGLLTMLTAKAMGATQIVITDLLQDRLDLAKKLGADHALRVDTRDAGEMARRVEEVLGCKPDICMECSGAESSMHTAIYATRPGGVAMLVGLGPTKASLPLVSAATREVDVRFSFRYANCFPLALEMMSSGKVNAKPLITHRFPLEDTLKGFETFGSGREGAIKVMIQCSQ